MSLPYTLVNEQDCPEAAVYLASCKRPRARSDGSQLRALESALVYARKAGAPTWVYCGNSYMQRVWLVVVRRSKTCGMDSTDTVVFCVAPDGSVKRYTREVAQKAA